MNTSTMLDRCVERLNSPKRMVCGVSAALAEKFDWSRMWTRVVCAVAIFTNPAMGLLLYFVLAIVLPKWERNF